MTAKYSRGVLLCLIATLSWGGMFPVMTSVLRHIDPFTFTCMRYALAGAAFFVVLVKLEGRAGLRLKGERLGLAWFFGSAGFAGFQFLVFLGQKWAGTDGALTASIMMATMPMLGFLVNWVVRKARPPLPALGFILLSFAGVSLVITKGNYGELAQEPGAFGADGLIILGALCWVIYTVGAAFFPHWSPYKYTAVTTGLGLATAVAITAGLVVFNAIQLPSGHDVALITPGLAYMASAAGFVGVLCWNLGNKILTPLNGVLFMDVVPVTAFTISAIQGVQLSLAQVAGAAVTATALVLNNLYLRHRMTPATPSPAPEPTAASTATPTAPELVTVDAS
jgi:drug/metabolite transporter (DMT)-like permease